MGYPETPVPSDTLEFELGALVLKPEKSFFVTASA